jgi:hypothetical protein
MIARIFPDAYDTQGRPTFRPDQKRRGRFPSTFPVGRYFSQPLTASCHSLEDLREFLSQCRYVSDKEQFGKEDYWMPPEDFEQARQGDCEDFALYAWRQLLQMGYEARLVGGTMGDPRVGHAWVVFQKDGIHYLLEPLARRVGLSYPRLDALKYNPMVSVEWDGKHAHFFSHSERKAVPPIEQLLLLVPEWIYYHFKKLGLVAYSLPRALLILTFRKLFKPNKKTDHRR